MTAGDRRATWDVGEMTWGLQVCYDLRFPELSRAMVLGGASVLVVIAAWPFPRVSHWTTLLRARAIENLSYVVAANRVGVDGDQTYCGSSRVVDPYGVVLASASENHETLITADLDPARVESVRKTLPSLSERREDLYR